MSTKLHKNFIAGAWVDGVSVGLNLNPSDTNDVIGEYARADAAQAAQAIDAAHEAQKLWANCTAEQRSDALDRIGTEILARQDELGTLLSREEGKTLAEGVGEVVRAGRVFKFFAGEALRLGGEKLPSIRAGVDVEVSREPEGVVGIITPWNFPIAIPAWKIAPALAYGNAVVFKPADLVPGSAWALSEIIARAGKLPDGVFNLVMGPGSKVGQTLATSRKVRAITFTGSVQTGRAIGLTCMERGAKVQLEMGGKNPLVILNDANLEQAVSVAINGSFFSTGQRCTGSSRLVVEDGIHDAFIAAMAKRMTIANRTTDKVRQLIERIRTVAPGVELLVGTDDPSGYDLVVNGTSLGLRGDDALPLDTARLHPEQTVAEIIMQPAETALLKEARARGCRIHLGAPMLASQIPLMAAFMRHGHTEGVEHAD